MTRTSFEEHNCSLARTVDLVGDKWTLLILRDAFYGRRSFLAFHTSLGVSRTVLSDRLKRLVDGRILERTKSKEDVERYDYRLTEAGRELFPVIIGLVQWGDRWVFGPGQEPMTIIDRKTGRPVQPLTVHDAGGQPLEARDVAFEIASGAS